jgi:DNA replication and repair protein RecF
MTAARLAVAVEPATETGRHAGAEAGTLWVARLALTDFRSYARLRLEPGPRPVVLIGPNGAGKTNLLEALSFLAPGRGLRGARLGEVTRRASPTRRWAVSARLQGPLGARDIGTGLDPAAGAAERRVTRIDGETVRGQAPLAERLGVVWLTPAMDRLFGDAPAARRRFLDRLVGGLEPGHAREVAAYEQSMRARARLLAAGAEAGWVAAAEETMAAHGVAVAAARREAVARLAAALGLGSGPFPRAGLGLDGEVERWLDEMAAVDAEQRLREALKRARTRDAEAGGAAHGPHRSDLVVRHLDNDMAADQCSTGEQKALLVAIVLANARLHAACRGETPLVLLDEVTAHLDGARRAALAQALCGLGAQAWLTGTDARLFEALAGRARFFTVGEGLVRPAPSPEPA